MEHTNPPAAKRISNILRVIFFMLRKGMSKGKLAFDLNAMMKRGKIAINNNHRVVATSAPKEYEFSCSNTPFHISRKRYSHFFACAQAPATQDDETSACAQAKMALEMFHSVGASPALLESPWLPGFGRSPAVRRLRVTDSPFPIGGVEEDTHVDEAAEEFIMKFYRDLRKQDVLQALQY